MTGSVASVIPGGKWSISAAPKVIAAPLGLSSVSVSRLGWFTATVTGLKDFTRPGLATTAS